MPVVCIAEGWRFSAPLALRTLVVIGNLRRAATFSAGTLIPIRISRRCP